MNPANGLTDRQITLLQASIAEMSADGDKISADFYERLFVLDPGLRYLFSNDMVEQHHSLIFMMGFVIGRLRSWTEICPRLRNLAIRHASYGVRTEDYATFGKAMMDTLSQHQSDAETLVAWACLFEAISATMIEAQPQ
jgi:hemoglobin-like flavoprotein